MRRIKLIVAYDGTEYSGWQIQPEAPTIEMYLDKAIRELTGENVHVTGASRTDAGVHAYGNVAVFDTESTIPGDRFTFALNRFLPDSIVIQDSWEVSSDFTQGTVTQERLTNTAYLILLFRCLRSAISHGMLQAVLILKNERSCRIYCW